MAAKPGPEKKVSAKKVPAVKVPAVKVPAKKAAAKKVSAKKASARNTARRVSGSAVGVEPRDQAVAPSWAQRGDLLTTNEGTPLSDTDNSLKGGSRGPTLMEDFHFREKITHFDHERIPERVVHARGAGAHGEFRLYEAQGDLTSARFLNDTAAAVPVFVRFSTVAGSRGSADTARDVRGFATRFYTDAGTFDLVGNNMPIFFIQDGIKFPDLVHAAKPEPDREIPQAQTAHDTFWDFASLAPESTAMLMWIMSDRAIPRSLRTMEGFGIHTFRLVNDQGGTCLVKFHWKPLLGIHSLVWDESQKLGGVDPDFHRRDLWNAIEAGNYPEWELGLQVVPDAEDQMFEGIDLLDPTKIIPEEIAPVRLIGRMTLNRNPQNYFAETEQVAFHPGHLVRGIEITDDPLIQARLFSYLDTQLTRLGGPNFAQLPINRPRAEVSNHQRDGFGQQAIHQGRAAYAPTSVGGCPVASVSDGYVHLPRAIEGVKTRERGVSNDYFSQARLFWLSMSDVEKDHIVSAFSFELANVSEIDIQDRLLGNLANVDAELTERVAAHLGRPAPRGEVASGIEPSPALSMARRAPGPVTGRIIGVLVAPGADPAGIQALRRAVEAEQALIQVVAANGLPVAGIQPDRTFLVTQSLHFDAIVVAGGAEALSGDPAVAVMLQEAFRHYKALAAWGSGAEVLVGAGIDVAASGVIVSARADRAFNQALIEAVGWHRHWDR